jgi:ribosome biogenesis GTPase
VGRDAAGGALSGVRDEEDRHDRAGPGSRPRSRLRPRHGDAVDGRVVAVDRGRYACQVADRSVVAVTARELGRRRVFVGDRVGLVGDLSGASDALARIVRVDPRTTELRRTSDDTDPVERVVVANAEQMVVVASLADPPPRLGLVDRCLVAAADAGVAPLLCLTKADLAPADDLLAVYRSSGVDVLVTGRSDAGAGLARLADRLDGHTSVLVGHSGVGKSTIVNALVPAAARRTGEVNPVTGRGRHVSVSVVMVPFRSGFLVDTPGVRSFGLGHVSADGLLRGFPELVAGTSLCPSDCDHRDPTVCGLDEWVAAGHAHAARLTSFRQLLESRDAEPV